MLLTLQESMEDRSAQRRQARLRNSNPHPLSPELLPSRSSLSSNPTDSKATKSAGSGSQGQKRFRPVPRGFMSLNEHIIPTSHHICPDAHMHHRETSGFTRELGLLPSCKRRRTACSLAYLISQGASQQADRPTMLQPGAPRASSLSFQQQQLPPILLKPAQVSTAAAINAAEIRPGMDAAGDPDPEQPKDSTRSRRGRSGFQAAMKASDGGSQDGSDRSSSDRLHIADSREQRGKQRATRWHTKAKLPKPATASAGRISKRKGVPHRSC